jgi:hypothetical protein
MPRQTHADLIFLEATALGGDVRNLEQPMHAHAPDRCVSTRVARVGRCSLPLARSLPTRWTRLGPCGPPTAEEQQLVTSIASVLTPYVPCRRARLCRVYCLSLGVSQSVSQSVACNRNRAYYCHTLNEPAGHRRAARRPIPTDGWFYVTIRYDMNTFFLFCFEKMLYYFLFGRETFDPLACTALFFFLPLILVFLFFYAAACSSLCEHRSYTSIQS